MAETGYIWPVSDGEIGVLVPVAGAPIWQKWLRIQDASLRRFKPLPTPGYWIFKEAQREAILERFIVSGWCVSYEKPYIFHHAADPQPKDPPRLGSLLPPQAGVFSTLFVRDDAPKSVVDAAYRALMKDCHPDTNEKGEEIAKHLNSARDEIYKTRGW